jgi:hypothetical protein
MATILRGDGITGVYTHDPLAARAALRTRRGPHQRNDPAQAAALLIDLLDNEATRLKAVRAAKERFRCEHDAAVVWPELRSFLLRASEQHPREPEGMR